MEVLIDRSRIRMTKSVKTSQWVWDQINIVPPSWIYIQIDKNKVKYINDKKSLPIQAYTVLIQDHLGVLWWLTVRAGGGMGTVAVFG